MQKNRSILRFTLVVFALMNISLVSYAQMRKYQTPNRSPFQARQLAAGLVLPSAGEATFEITGKPGFEIMYGATTKYSERFEMWGAYTYTKAGFEYNIFQEKRENMGSYYGTYTYTPYAMPVSMHSLALNILPTFYIIPDVVGIFGGVDLGVAFFLYNHEELGETKIVYSKEDLTPLSGSNVSGDMLTDVAVSLHGQENFVVFNYGLQFGGHYTYNEQLRLYMAYSMQLNNQFEEGLNTFAGAPKVSAFRLGVAYLFQSDNSKNRF